MRRTIVVAMGALLIGVSLVGLSTSTATAAGTVGPPNPLQWIETTKTKCDKKYKPSVTRGIALSASVQEKRRGTSQGQTTSSGSGSTKSTPYYYNYPLKADRVRYCEKSKVVNAYLPVKFKRFHRTYNVTSGGLAVRTVIVRDPLTGFKDCYKAYLHPDTRKTRKTCDGETFS